MTLTVLSENAAGDQFYAEHGLSYLIEHDGQKILFDTGHSDVFLKNTEKLGIDIQTEIETIILSHGHFDHGDGLQYLDNKTLICHPSSFIRRYRRKDISYIGLALTKNQLKQKYNLVTSDKPYKINEKIIFLGEIPRLNNFEAQSTPFIDEYGNEDFVLDDSAIAIIQNDEIIVVAGCSHAGICNITEHAKNVCRINKVNAVIGGFHLKEKNKQTEETIQYFKNQKIKNVYPSHCTEIPVLKLFNNEFGTQQIRTGMILNF